jgi:hypothetical protein
MRKLRPGQLANQNSSEYLAVSANAFIAEYPADSITSLDRFQALGKRPDTSLYMHLERRAGTRLNLQQLGTKASARLRVSVELGQRQFEVKARDMSIKDICVETTREVARHGDRVDITLSYDDMAVVLPAIAVRQDRAYMYTAFIFLDDKGNALSTTNFYLDLIFHSIEAEVNKARYGRLASFMLSAACSMLFVSWAFF